MGEHGFIGSELAKRDLPPAVYFFDSPSSNILFDKHLTWCMRETINDFIEILDYCKKTDTFLVFPSSATVYNKNTSYSRCKAICEELAQAYGVRYLGLRIAAGYGPNEAHKGDYASVIYQWCKQMKKGERPIIFGDGKQTRDFIYQSDIADNIEKLAKEGKTGIVDLGTGVNTSFNEVVKIINECLGTDIKPIYIDKPKTYVENTPCTPVRCTIELKRGVQHILEALDEDLLQRS